MMIALFGLGLTVLSVIVAALGIYFSRRLSQLQLSIQQQEHKLSVLRASPNLGSSVISEERHDNGPHYPAFLYLIVTIYSEGELAVTKLKGEWNIVSQHGVANCRVPFDRDVLGSTPYQLQPYRLKETGDIGSKNIRFDMYINFSYFSPADNQRHQYSAHYSYNPDDKVIRID